MPLVKRSLADMMPLAAICDVMVNPVNTVGVMGAGLAKAFADRYPEMLDAYRVMCRGPDNTLGTGMLQIGKLHIYPDKASGNIIVNLPTKRHFGDTSNIDDVEIGIIKLAAYLQQHPFYTVAMPILGTGLGKLDIDAVYPVLARHLDALPNIIHLCMRPDRFEHPPRYLGIIGSRAYRDYDRIDLCVCEALVEFGLGFEDFEAAVSGGAPGVDRIGCGTGESGDTNPNVARSHGLRTIVCHADWERYHKTAGFLRNRTVADIITHVAAFVGRKSFGTRSTIDLIKRYNIQVDSQIASRQQANEDVFNSSTFHHPLPVKKILHIIDIADISI